MADLPKRSLGVLGPEVSIIGLGCNNFGRRVDLDGTRAVVDAALAEGDHLLRHLEHLRRPHGRSEEFLGEVLRGPPRPGRARDQVRDGHGRRPGPRGLARLHPPGGPGFAAPPADRRHRLLLVPPARRRDPDRRDARNARRARAAGTYAAIGASNFSAEQIEEADAVARDRGFTPVHGDPERVQPAEPRGRARGAVDLRAARPRLRPVLPPGFRTAHGQVPPGRAGACWDAARGPADRLGPTSSST